MIIPDFYGILPYNRTGIHRTVVGANEVLFEILRHSPGPRGGSGARKKCDQGATRRGLGATKMSQQYNNPKQKTKIKKRENILKNISFFWKARKSQRAIRSNPKRGVPREGLFQVLDKDFLLFTTPKRRPGPDRSRDANSGSGPQSLTWRVVRG